MKNWNTLFHNILQEYKEKEYYADAALAVFHRGGVCFKTSVGDAAPDSVFDLASLTKLFTTTELLHILSSQRIGMDTYVLEYLDIPEQYELLRETLSAVTIRQLLTHTSGLPAWYPLYAGEGTLWERYTCALENEEPVEQGVMCYSDLGFILVGKLVEKMSGQTLQEAVDTIIRKPLSIQNLRYLPRGTELSEEERQNIVVSSYGNGVEEKMCSQRNIRFAGFRPEGKAIQGEANDGNAWYYFGGVSGHAGLFSNVEGVSALGQLYLNTEEPLLCEALHNQGQNRGLGFEFGRRYPRGCGHTGFTGTSLFLSKELGVGGVLLTNRLANKKGETPSVDACRIAVHQMIAENAEDIINL